MKKFQGKTYDRQLLDVGGCYPIGIGLPCSIQVKFDAFTYRPYFRNNEGFDHFRSQFG